MGLADTVTKAYMMENTVFADAYNYLIYGGKAVVNPARLQELDTTEIALPFGAQNENRTQPDDAVQKYRDVLKSAVIKQKKCCWSPSTRRAWIEIQFVNTFEGGACCRPPPGGRG